MEIFRQSCAANESLRGWECFQVGSRDTSCAVSLQTQVSIMLMRTPWHCSDAVHVWATASVSRTMENCFASKSLSHSRCIRALNSAAPLFHCEGRRRTQLHWGTGLTESDQCLQVLLGACGFEAPCLGKSISKLPKWHKHEGLPILAVQCRVSVFSCSSCERA